MGPCFEVPQCLGPLRGSLAALGSFRWILLELPPGVGALFGGSLAGGGVPVGGSPCPGCVFGVPQVRDDVQRLHPCLLSFHSLPEPERGYNLQMSGETLK